MLGRAVADAMNAAWKLLYGFDLDARPSHGAMRDGGLPGAVIFGSGCSDIEQPTARFSVLITSNPRSEESTD